MPAILSLFPACTEQIEIRTDNTSPAVVIYGVLTNEQRRQEVKIGISSPYFDILPNRSISDAGVAVRSSDGTTYSFAENDTVPGLYCSKTPFGVETGLTYSLTVDTEDGGGAYEASTGILPCPPIDSLTLEPIDMFGHRNYMAFVHFADPPEKNFYLFRVFYNDSLITGTISNCIITDDAFFNNQPAKHLLYMFDDDDVSEWETGPEENRRNSFYLKPGDSISVEMSAISGGYFNFIRQCRQEKRGENPMFGGPPSNIDTNISNGGVGYFAAYGILRRTVVFN
jgi:hypothetical protein